MNNALKVGDRVCNTGDIANQPKTGTVINFKTDPVYGERAVVEWDSEGGSAWISELPVENFFDPSPFARYRMAKAGERQALPRVQFHPDLTNVY